MPEVYFSGYNPRMNSRVFARIFRRALCMLDILDFRLFLLGFLLPICRYGGNIPSHTNKTLKKKKRGLCPVVFYCRRGRRSILCNLNSTGNLILVREVA